MAVLAWGRWAVAAKRLQVVSSDPVVRVVPERALEAAPRLFLATGVIEGVRHLADVGAMMTKNARLATTRGPTARLLIPALWVLFVMVAFLPRTLAKDPDPNSSTSAANATGYNRNSAYTSIDGPEIDAFNFNFVVQFPLAVGLNYPENAGVSLQLSLTYNSRVWFWQNQMVKRKFFRIRRQNPFGLGFDLNLGRIIKTLVANVDAGQYAYVDSSGATHRLAPFQGTEYHSRDGSHIRAVLENDVWIVSFPNGVVQELGHYITGSTKADMADPSNSCTAGGDDYCPEEAFVPDASLAPNAWDRAYVGWHATKIYTRASLDASASPSYTVAYYDGDDAAFAHMIKEITDQFGRRIWTEIDRTNGTVTAIHAPAPADECGTARTADYFLNYGTTTLTVTVPNPVETDPPSTVTYDHVARVLTSISGPNVAQSFGATNCTLDGTQRYVHEFEYQPTAPGNLGGQLKTITYPSGKKTVIGFRSYSYQNGGPGYCMQFGTDSCSDATWGGGSCNHSSGVNRVDTYLDGNVEHGEPGNLLTTTFAQSQVRRDWYSDPPGICSPSSPEPGHPAGYERFDQVHTMVDPAGNKTEFRYRTPKESGEEDWYGLLVSQKFFGGSGSTARLYKQVDYDYSRLDSYAFSIKEIDFEMAPKQIKTTWADDTDESGAALTFATVLTEDRSKFDGFGHYQRAEFSGTAIGDEHKIVVKDYASDNTTSSPGPLCSAPAMECLRDNWLGDVVVQEAVLTSVSGAETVVSRSDYGFDCNTGLRTRAVNRSDVSGSFDQCGDAPSPSPGDETTDYTFFPRGDLSAAHRYLTGADSVVNAPTDSTTRYTYSYGVQESAKQDALNYFDVFRVIDPGSGLVVEERSTPTSPTDLSAVTITRAYDLLGRTTKVRHGSDDPVVVSYENDPEESWGPPSPAVRLARVRTTQGSGNAMTESVDHFLLGRYDHAEKLNPDGSRAYQYALYDDAGHVVSTSEWTRQSSIVGVPATLSDYGIYSGTIHLFDDPFGRPTKITDALGNVSTTRYFGLNKQVTVHGVALHAATLGAVADVTTTYYTDALGRLRLVTKPVGGDPAYTDAGAGARYTYDILGRLRSAEVSPTATMGIPSNADRYVSAAPNAQLRTFDFDAIGHQTSVTTPEQGTVENLAWNVFGQVTENRDAQGAARGHKHRTTYDGAGRPTRLERIAVGGETFDTLWNAGDSGWSGSGWNVATNCLGGTSWYIGDAQCHYAQASGGTGIATLTSPVVTLGGSTVLTFKYFREVRDETQSGGSRDRFRVLVQNANLGHDAPWYEVLNLDSSQVSWPKWVQSPALDLYQVADVGGQVRIRFEFNSVDQNVEAINLRGIGISQIELKRPAAVTLQETYYDEALGLGGNNALGKPTRIKEYDEATSGAIFTRELHYVDPNGRLSDEAMSFDWDRDGVNQLVVDDYLYDSRGDLWRQRKPHVLGASTRLYEYSRSHGAVIGVTATNELTGAVQNVLSTASGSGVEYNDAGGMSLVRFGNGLQQHVEPNAEFLPNRIWVDGGAASPPIWDTGQYLYDGVRNIKQIGLDYYRYDAAMRLTWERINTNNQGVVDINQTYDPFGNMTAQTAVQAGSYASALPQGMTFAGRSFEVGGQNVNRIGDAGFYYDLNGNLKGEPAHDGLTTSQRYMFSPEDELERITPGSAESHPGSPLQTALYEGGDHRWFRSVWAEGSRALITLRDASGQVVADFEEKNASSGLQLGREYVHANGQLIAINSTCGPRPYLVASGETSNPNLVWFDRTDYGVTSTGGYTIYIRSANGETRTIGKGFDLSTHFSIPQSDFFPNVMNWVQIETDAACGHTGYSNAISYSYLAPGGGGTCLPSMTGGRVGFAGSGSKLKVGATSTCGAGTEYNVYFLAAGDDAIVTLNGSTPTTIPNKLLSSLPCGSGEGTYWIARVVDNFPVEQSPPIVVNGSSCGGSVNALGTSPPSLPGQPGMNLQYVHWDHLGSTRMMTDENGVSIAAFKYYPFGMEAESSGGDELRQRFTGHERDESAGLDYMMARSCRMALARFLEPDPDGEGSYLDDPQSWNGYAYVRNNPIGATDPDGQDDLRTAEEVQMLEDVDVLAANGEVWVESSRSGYEWGYQILRTGTDGDYTATSPTTDRDYFSVNVGSSEDTEGRVHSHQFMRVPDGKGGFISTVPNEPGPDDGANAASNKKTGYVLAPGGLMRVRSKTDSLMILTKKDWRSYLKRAKRVFKAVQKAKKEAVRKEKAKKHKRAGTGTSASVVEQLGAGNNEPLSGW